MRSIAQRNSAQVTDNAELVQRDGHHYTYRFRYQNSSTKTQVGTILCGSSAGFHVTLKTVRQCRVSSRMEPNGFPSRTSILTAAARAFGSREPDASVRNPDWVADRLIGPDELALIADHPISKAFDRDFQEAIHDPDVFGFAWLMLVRTRCIDELMERAVHNGATQLVILGAGFDTRAHRFTELLKDVAVFEIDYGATQEYKKQRVKAALGGAPANVAYSPIDFARERLGEVLRRAGFESRRKTYYICEGLSMYVPEERSVAPNP